MLEVFIQLFFSINISGTFVCDGNVSAIGDVSGRTCGAGAGGSITVRAVSITGSGRILARGGDAKFFNGAGGGGRIVLMVLLPRIVCLPRPAVADSQACSQVQPSYSLLVDASGGNGVTSKCSAGGAGTIFVFSDAVVICDNHLRETTVGTNLNDGSATNCQCAFPR